MRQRSLHETNLELALDRDFEREPTYGQRRRIPLHVDGAVKQHIAGTMQPPVKR
jgi:hypothetical protein